jgi:hypothetical protein
MAAFGQVKQEVADEQVEHDELHGVHDPLVESR